MLAISFIFIAMIFILIGIIAPAVLGFTSDHTVGTMIMCGLAALACFIMASRVITP